MFRLFAAAVVLALVASVALTDDKKRNDPISEIPNDKVDKIETKGGVVTKPTPVTSAEELEKLVKDEATRKRLAAVDFKTHTLLVFAWEGSGKDKLEYAIQESSPEQVAFTHKKGETDDLRRHVRLYVLRKDVKWAVK